MSINEEFEEATDIKADVSNSTERSENDDKA